MIRYKLNNSVYENIGTISPIKRNEVSMEGHTAVGMTEVKDVDKANGILFGPRFSPVGLGNSSDHPHFKAAHIGNLKPDQIKEILDSTLKNGYVDLDKYIEVTVTKLKDIPSDKVYYYYDKPERTNSPCIGSPIPQPFGMGHRPMGVSMSSNDTGYSDFFRTGSLDVIDDDYDDDDYDDDDDDGYYDA